MESLIYANYHRHSNYSIVVAGGDSVVKNEEYAIRAIELGHTVISGVEHGFQGRHIEGYELAKQYGLKFVFGSEAYWVKNRFEKDRTNNHIIILAKNERGRKAINRALSEAWLTGYYYVPRLDLDIIFNLPKNDVWITSACIGGWKYDDSEDIWKTFHEKFGNNFFLELQYHNTDRQKKLNERILNLSRRTGIKTIFGCDSHYIYPEQEKDRDMYLESKNIFYEDERGWYMDYPSGRIAYERFRQQDILSHGEIIECIANTNIIESVEEYHSPVYTKEIKMPTIYPNKNEEEKNNIYKSLVWNGWEEEKKKINPSLWKTYEKEIQKEIDVATKINHADYFILDYEIVRQAKERGGIITSTGRGSAVSWITCKLLGLTKIDRIASPVKLYPERFLTEERIKQTGSLADIDLNLANPEIFLETQKELLGNENSYTMIAWGTMKTKEAWKMYARANHVSFEIANAVSEQLDNYENDLRRADDDEKENILVENYIYKQYLEMFLQSKKYLGIYSNIRPHPCASLVAPFNIIDEAGIVAIKSINKNVNVCTIVDGSWAEKYGMLKNDLLKVSVVELYSNVYKRIGFKDTHDAKEIWEIFKNDSGMQEIYAKEIVMGVNQVEQIGTRKRVSQYAPKNISELSSFVAAIRPGFSSMYSIYESREPFSYGIPSFDDIIKTEEMPHSFVLYQEQSMAALAYAGIPIHKTYDIVKSIAKKRYDDVLKYKKIFLDGFSKKIVEKEGANLEIAESVSERVWKILEDSARYSFNSSHSLCVATDSLYVAWLKSHHPLYFYEQFLKILEKGGEKKRLALTKNEAEKNFGITFPKFEFGQDNRNIIANPENNSITMSLKTIKGFGDALAEDMINLYKMFEGNEFLDLLILAEEINVFSKKWESLIKIGYFNKFGKRKKLLIFYNEFKSGKNRYNSKLKEKTKNIRKDALQKIWEEIPNNDLAIREIIWDETEILGEPITTFPLDGRWAVVLTLDDKWSPKLKLYFLKTGKIGETKVSKKEYKEKPISEGDFIFCSSFEKKPRWKKLDDGSFEPIPNTEEWWVKNYKKGTEKQLEKEINDGKYS